MLLGLLQGLLKEGLYILEFTVSTILDLLSETKPPGELDLTKTNIVLVYGFSSTQAVMMPLQKKLKNRGCNVLIPDLGFTIYDIDWHAEKLADFFRQQKKLLQEKHGKTLADLQDKIILFGHSMGGLIILAAQRIDRELLNIPVITAGTPLKGSYATIFAFLSPAANQMHPDSLWLKEIRQDMIPHPRKILYASALLDELVPSSSSHINDNPWITTEIIGHMALVYELVLDDLFKRVPR